MRKKVFIWLVVCLAVGAMGIVGYQKDLPSDLRYKIGGFFDNALIREDPIPPDVVFDAAYILGGAPSSLILKLLKVAELYHKGMVEKILILDQPGIAEYDHKLMRNLSNNEWAIKKLTQFGIPKDQVEIIPMASGFFGTFNEVRYISILAKKRGYQQLLLISALYHTKRVGVSFEHFLNGQVALCVQSSVERYPLKSCMVEYFKLFVYRTFLIS